MRLRPLRAPKRGRRPATTSILIFLDFALGIWMCQQSPLRRLRLGGLWDPHQLKTVTAIISATRSERYRAHAGNRSRFASPGRSTPSGRR